MALAISEGSILAFRNQNFKHTLLFDQTLQQIPVQVKLHRNEPNDRICFLGNDLYVWGGTQDMRQSRIERINVRDGQSYWLHEVCDTTEHIAISPDSSTIAVGSGMHEVDFVDVETGQLKSTLYWANRCKKTIFDILGFSADGKRIFLNCSEKISEIDIHDLSERTLTLPEWSGYEFWMDDSQLMTIGLDDTRITNTLTSTLSSLSVGIIRGDFDVVLSSHKKRVIYVGNPSEKEVIYITIIDVSQNKKSHEFCMFPSGYVHGIAIDDVHDRLFVELSSNQVFWYDLKDVGAPERELVLNDSLFGNN